LDVWDDDRSLAVVVVAADLLMGALDFVGERADQSGDGSRFLMTSDAFHPTCHHTVLIGVELTKHDNHSSVREQLPSATTPS
jgi:hypothetical protein